MTVCIGAISHWAPDGQAVVVASDHMVTMGGFMQYEHDVPKIKFVSSKICVMMAGDTLSATTLIQQLSSHFRTGEPSVEDVVNTAKTFYEQLRQDQIETEVFRPRGFTMQQFYQEGLQSRLQPHLVGAIDDEVMSYDLGVELLVAGVDSEGAHIYTVGNPGAIGNYKHTGYVSVGSGQIHAVQSLIGFKHSAYRSLYETIFEVYASKRRAEAAPGVGTETDLCFIPPGEMGWVLLNRQQLSKLDRLYTEFSQPAGQEIARKVGDLNLFGDEEENESQTNSAEVEQPDNSAKSFQETVQS